MPIPQLNNKDFIHMFVMGFWFGNDFTASFNYEMIIEFSSFKYHFENLDFTSYQNLFDSIIENQILIIMVNVDKKHNSVH